jgi:Protein of unknown function (DUF2591)
MRVSELEGVLLDYWVAEAEGMLRMMPGTMEFRLGGYSPSTKWREGGPIIEREGIGIWKGYDSERSGKVEVWEASTINPVSAIEAQGPQVRGPTPLVAAMRAYIRLKFGEEVEDEPPVAD